jgi:hypothetical protein
VDERKSAVESVGTMMMHKSQSRKLNHHSIDN